VLLTLIAQICTLAHKITAHASHLTPCRTPLPCSGKPDYSCTIEQATGNIMNYLNRVRIAAVLALTLSLIYVGVLLYQQPNLLPELSILPFTYK
jgi:hypothetical protein